MRMLCGDFPFTRHPTVLNAIYMITFIIVVFIMALNFLLAVIVGAFDRVKEEVEICLVEDNVFVDAWYSFIYFYHRFTKGLPSRRNVSLAPKRVRRDRVVQPLPRRRRGTKRKEPIATSKSGRPRTEYRFPEPG